MRLGININGLDESILCFAAQLGVTDVMVHRPDAEGDGYYDFMGLLKVRTQVESAGLRFAGIGNLRRDWKDKMVYGLPGWEQQIDDFCRTVRNAGRAGVPVIVYTFPSISLQRIYRTHLRDRGRGGALVTSHDQSLLANAPQLGPKPLTKDEIWENFARFLERVVPVAEEAGVKLALHPDDPPLPPVGGIASLLESPDDFRRAIELAPSEMNGVCFCQGCFTEMAGEGVYDEIRYFGERDKIFAVHFRNLKGTMPKFAECFIDDGDINMYRALRIYAEVGYDGVLVPDHVPHLVGIGPDRYASWAFPLGYMRALMSVLEG